MRILFVCHRMPFPPKRGGKIRPFNIIRHLSESHEVTVASIARSVKEAEEGQGLEDYCDRYLVEVITPTMAIWNMVKCFFQNLPFSMGYFYSRRLRRRILEEMARRDYDLIMVHCSSVAQYVEDIHGIPKILDFGDMDSQKWLIYSEFKRFPESFLYLLEGTRLQKAEVRLARHFHFCTCTTANEWITLNGYRTGVPSDWFPNGVDFEYFSPSREEDYDAETICFVGRMDYYPNQEGMLNFCKNIFPLIRAKCPRARMKIIGANPSRAIQRLSMIPGVTVTGTVKDVQPYVRSSAVNVVPLNIARGTQNKILEALAMGVPTVTSVEAAKGVDAIGGEHFLVASNHRQFADDVLRLLSDLKERKKFSEKGRQRMIKKHDWHRSMEKLDEIIDRCIKGSDSEVTYY
jgi:sugar transferase (PEP-CTERM/EpsH1 system associated)